ncbi:hypothetical protein DGWBC_1552 [Dehalogenimonas sp. WBC-2]|nr:hypothetical protein DGWBC_1552 [Dehalogenimonas sp. WBC-2]
MGAAARLWAAPLSATEDVAQFWSFAQLFKEHGLDFYRYSSGTEPINPMVGWGFVYPPVWLLILGLALAVVPAALAGANFVDTAWRLAMKTPIITADIVIGIVLFMAVPGSRWRKLIFASLWLLNPAAWYESAVFGQFDAIAAAFLLGALILFERGHDRWAFGVAALAVLTKQHTLLPVLFMTAAVIRTMPWRRMAGNLVIFGSVIAIISLPFMITGAATEYVRAVLLPGQYPTYQYPILYSFSGSGALVTYLHDTFGWDNAGWLQINTPLLAATVAGGLAITWFKKITPLRAMLVGILLFIAIFYRINYQYLIIFIPLAILAASRTKYLSERVISLGLALVPAIWLWLFKVSFWFNLMSPVFPNVEPLFERIGWNHIGLPDHYYVILALSIMLLALAYVIYTFTRWRLPSESTSNIE